MLFSFTLRLLEFVLIDCSWRPSRKLLPIISLCTVPLHCHSMPASMSTRMRSTLKKRVAEEWVFVQQLTLDCLFNQLWQRRWSWFTIAFFYNIFPLDSLVLAILQCHQYYYITIFFLSTTMPYCIPIWHLIPVIKTCFKYIDKNASKANPKVLQGLTALFFELFGNHKRWN